MNTSEVNNLVSKIPNFSGQNEKILLEEFVLLDDEDGENEDICFLFRRFIEGKADRIFRLIKEEEEINLNI
jgi:hypothetical protein